MNASITSCKSKVLLPSTRMAARIVLLIGLVLISALLTPIHAVATTVSADNRGTVVEDRSTFDTKSPRQIPGSTQQEVVDIIPINIRSSLLAGEFLLNGALYQESDLSSYAVELSRTRDPTNKVFLGYFYDQEYAVSVIKGVYRPDYYYQFGDVVPNNYGQRLAMRINAILDTVTSIDIESIDVAFQPLLNGGVFPSEEQELAHLFLKPRNSENLIFIGATNSDNPPVKVLPGVYSVVYDYVSGERIPVNTHATLPKNLRLTTSGTVEIPIQSEDVLSRFTLNGDDFPDSAYDYGKILLVDELNGGEAFIGNTYSPSTATQVLRGRYNAHYRSTESGALTPHNTDTIIESNIRIGRARVELLLNVETIEISGQFTVNGAATPASAYEYANISLVDPNTGGSVPLGQTFSQSYSPKLIIPGAYDVRYEHREGSILPANKNTVFERNVALESTGVVDIDIPSVTISSDLLLNGEAFPLSAYDYANIYVRESNSDEETDTELLFGSTLDGVLEMELLPGEYDFVYNVRESQGEVPLNRSYHFLTNHVINHSTEVAYDFRTRSIQLEATHNGEPFPDSPYVNAHLYLSTNADDRISFGLTSETPESKTLLVGRYDIVYSIHEPGDYNEIPINTDAIVGRVTVD